MIVSLWTCAVLAATPIQLQEVREAARNNTEALKAELQLRSAEEQVVVSRSVVFPRLTLEAGGSGTVSGARRTFETIPDGTTPSGFRQQAIDVPGSSRANYNLNLTVSQLLYDGGRWWNQIAQSGAQAQAQAGQAAEQQLSSELEAIRRFYELFRAQRTLRVLDAMVERSALQRDRAEALFEAGRAQKRETIDAAVNLGTDRMAVLRQGQRIAAAQAELAVWLGRSGGEELVAVDPGILSQAASSRPTLEDALARARRQRPLLQAVAHQLKAAQESVQVAASGYLPRISAFASYGRQSPSADPFFTDFELQNSVAGGVTLQWDLFNGFSTEAQVKQADYSRSSAALALQQASHEVEGEVRRSVVALNTQLRLAEVAEGNLALAEQGLKLAEERFQAGAGSTLEVRDAQLKSTQAELAVLESRIDVEIARAALWRVTGGDSQGEAR